MRKILQYILRILAKRVISRYKPAVVGVTGSVGKTTAKESVYAVLSRKYRVRRNEENFNNEIGVPMAVLGIRPTGSKLSLIAQLFRAIWLAYGFPGVLSDGIYPEILVLELAADRPGDIHYLVDIVSPTVGVVSAIGEVPVHVEFYASPEAVATEKGRLIESLPAHNGLAVLNFDDQTVLDMKERSKAKVSTFGFSAPADGAGPDFRISDVSYFASEESDAIGGLSFKVNKGSTFVPMRIKNIIGQHQLYGVGAAIAVGTHFGLNMVEMAEALEGVAIPGGRMRLLKGVKNTIVIDDSYNASPLSMHAALDTLRDFAKAKQALNIGKQTRRVAVLGDMRELGKFEIQAHQAIGKLAAQRTDVLITVGSASKFISDAAAEAGQTAAEGMGANGQIMHFNTSDEAKLKVQEIMKEGDVVLVKGSHSIRMDKIVEEIEARF